MPPSADAKAPPQWSVVARTGRYEFHDHRMHWMAKSVPQQVTDKARRTKIVDWQVPLQAQGKSGAIKGELFWRGPGRARRSAPTSPSLRSRCSAARPSSSFVAGAALRRGERPASPRGEAW